MRMDIKARFGCKIIPRAVKAVVTQWYIHESECGPSAQTRTENPKNFTAMLALGRRTFKAKYFMVLDDTSINYISLREES